MKKDTLRSSRKLKTVVAAIFVTLIFAVFNPLELYYVNRSEFWFDITELLPLILFGGLIVGGVLSVLGVLLRGKVADMYTNFLIGLGVGFYVQGNFLNTGMQELAGQQVDWCEDGQRLLANCLIWLLCFVVPQVFTFFKRGRYQVVIWVLVAVITAMQGASLVASAVSTESLSEENDVQLTTEGMFELSPQKNIIVFIIDTLDATFYEEYVENDPAYSEWLADFIYFDNAVAGGAPTHFGVPLLLTGKPYDGQLYNAYKASAYEQTNFYDKLAANGYDTRIYTESEYISDDFFEKYVQNAKRAECKIADKAGVELAFCRFAAYKCFPNLLKNSLYFYSGDFTAYRDVEFEGDASLYELDDGDTITAFRKNGLSQSSADGAFRVYHLFGVHGPYTLKADGTTDGTNTSLPEQMAGIMSYLTDFFQEMRRLGIYDESTILITGDHGAVDLYQNPCILLKSGAGTKHNVHNTVHAPVTFENVLPTLSQAIDGNNSERGRTLLDEPDDHAKIRYHIAEQGLVRQYTGDSSYRKSMRFQIGYDARDTAQITMLGSAEQIPIYELDEIVSFAQGESGRACLAFGFSDPEANYTWCLQSGQIVFRTEKSDGDLLIEFYFPATFNGIQHMVIASDGKQLYEGEVESDSSISFALPREMIAEDGTATLNIACRDAVSPLSLAVSSDPRTLSVAFGTMLITAAS